MRTGLKARPFGYLHTSLGRNIFPMLAVNKYYVTLRANCKIKKIIKIGVFDPST